MTNDPTLIENLYSIPADEVTHTPFTGNRENLQKLIDGAKAYAEKYPNDFDMAEYSTAPKSRTYPAFAAKEKHVCGTTACFAGIGPTVKDLAPQHAESWANYVDRMFNPDAEEWDWLFSSDWNPNWLCQPDDCGTIWHAIARAEYLLAVGLPSNAYAQACRDEPITYGDYVKIPA